jgi:DNA-binding response OmpR family regulator
MAGPAAEAGPVSVLLAEHEPEVAEMSARYLRRDGLGVRLVTTPEMALEELTRGPDAAAVLDLTMPGLDPRRVRRALRTPVIFLVSGPRPRGLARASARRWLGRPFSPRQLAAMVRDLLTMPEHAPLAGRSAGRLRMDGPSRTALAGGEPVPLTATEFAILAAMMDHPGRVLSRRSLLVAAGRDGAGDRAADVYIAQLRAKVGSAAVIRTVRGAGYALDPVRGGQ